MKNMYTELDVTPFEVPLTLLQRDNLPDIYASPRTPRPPEVPEQYTAGIYEVSLAPNQTIQQIIHGDKLGTVEIRNPPITYIRKQQSTTRTDRDPIQDTEDAPPRYWVNPDSIANGVFGHIYEAWDTISQDTVILKIHNLEPLEPSRDLVKDLLNVPAPERIAENIRITDDILEKEAITLAQLRHPHIVTIRNFIPDKYGRHVIVEERIEGESLQHTLSGDSPPTAQVLINQIAQICDAVDYMAARNIFHRDIKPTNILITQTGEAILIDLGSATTIVEADYGGTPYYQAPELLSASGKPTTTIESEVYALAKIVQDSITSNDTETRLTPILNRALDNNPNNRYHTATEFANALKDALK